jgi:hypothetical protein
LGFHPCVHNILYELTYCDPLGLNISLPPENLHAIRLGLFMRLLQGFSRAKQNRNENHFVFGGLFHNELELDFKKVGYELSQQSDPDLPRTYFPSGYIPNPTKTEDGTTGKKAGHELCGVLLTIYVYLLQQEATENIHKNMQLRERMGEDRLASFAKMFEISMLFESWLNKETFTEFEVTLVEKFLPLWVKDLVETISRTDGYGMKLLKVHLIGHFAMMTRLFGSPINVDSSSPESNLKTRVKNPANKTRRQAHDFEKRTASKDHESMILYSGASEIVREGKGNFLVKYLSDMKFLMNQEDMDTVKRRTGVRFILKTTQEDGRIIQDIIPHNALYKDKEWNGLIQPLELKEFLIELEGINGNMNTQYNATSGIKYRGNPMQGRHDWAIVQHGNDRIMCQFLCFMEIGDEIEMRRTAIDSVDKKGIYAIVHYVDQDVFGSKPTRPLYGAQHKRGHGFRIDQNCMLLTGWSKHTNFINGSNIPDNTPKATIAVVKVKNILMPCTGIADYKSRIPHSYLFLPTKKLGEIFLLRELSNSSQGCMKKW